ncbi:protein-tyrosine phosphatase family protein [Undibacterium sp. Ji83W]|uniref:protein-tyrosine phosphatase family protein n=1 Tax=Undibacterium sp. Ji83W TaxID=3413043 RepID=UPI003BEF5E21
MMTTKRPHQNTYWVRPGQLLAGEYPGALNEATAAQRLGQYLDCGVDYFIDLTEEDELDPYAQLLMKLAEERGMQAQHRRFAIPDRHTPSSRGQMQEILQALHEALAKQHTVYVHCFGGIGRTGTVIGCYLAEQHQDSKAGLQELAQLWQQMEKKRFWPETPQTTEQHAWVLAWPVDSNSDSAGKT